MSQDDFWDMVDSLPVPGVDEMPPPVELSTKDKVLAAEAKRVKRSLLDPKVDTETRTKGALESKCGMRLKKDGDWAVSAGGHRFWAKKVADYVGSTPGTDGNYHTYVEVKGISPGKTFAFSRLDKPNKKGEPSQFEKLTDSWEHGNLVFLALGWWVTGPNSEHMIEEKGSKKFTRWFKDTVELEVALIPWGRWIEHTEATKRRSITHAILLREFGDCMIVKERNRWHFSASHWWQRRLDDSPLFGGALIV